MRNYELALIKDEGIQDEVLYPISKEPVYLKDRTHIGYCLFNRKTNGFIKFIDRRYYFVESKTLVNLHRIFLPSTKLTQVVYNRMTYFFVLKEPNKMLFTGQNYNYCYIVVNNYTDRLRPKTFLGIIKKDGEYPLPILDLTLYTRKELDDSKLNLATVDFDRLSNKLKDILVDETSLSFLPLKINTYAGGHLGFNIDLLYNVYNLWSASSFEEAFFNFYKVISNQFKGEL